MALPKKEAAALTVATLAFIIGGFMMVSNTVAVWIAMGADVGANMAIALTLLLVGIIAYGKSLKTRRA